MCVAPLVFFMVFVCWYFCSVHLHADNFTRVSSMTCHVALDSDIHYIHDQNLQCELFQEPCEFSRFKHALVSFAGKKHICMCAILCQLVAFF